MHSTPHASTRYDWPRFWLPRGTQSNLSDGGYLYDPLSEYGRIYNPQARPIAAMEQVPCLVLLGEPGMGKSFTLDDEYSRMAQTITDAGDAVLRFNLRAYQSESRLVEKVFRNPTVRSWIESDNQLHLFLDSLDECLLRIETVAALLVEELADLPVDRLFLRIACRTAEWPKGLEEKLGALWRKDQVETVELAPLRRRDVLHAAEIEGIDRTAFLEEVALREAVPLAIKPVTLGLLLNTYRNQGGFPATQVELYRAGCRLLCAEIADEPRAARPSGALSAEQRLAVASRLAAITVFSNRYAIWTSRDRGDVPEADVAIEHLYGGTETVLDQAFAVSETAIRETLDTGLFSARGPGEMGWAHQTYAEFLAAQYVISHDLSLAQRNSLIIHSSDPNHRVVPQLRDVAAWLASMAPDLFKDLAQRDPEVLLRSDVASADAQDRRTLVDGLLSLYDAEKAVDFDLALRGGYRKLAQPHLAQQLRPYITNRSKGMTVRRVAIDMAEACQVGELQGDLLHVALDFSDDLHIRENAAHAVGSIGNDTTRALLRPLADGQVGEDPDDGLKGAALRALWPSLIAADELFPLLTSPKNPNLFGGYWGFVRYDLVTGLQVDDLPTALRWVEQHTRRSGFPHMIEHAAEEIMLRGWQHFSHRPTRIAFLQAASVRLKYYLDIVGRDRKDIFIAELQADRSRRYEFTEELVTLLARTGASANQIAAYDLPLISDADIPWMIEQLQRASTDEVAQIWATLISWNYVIGNTALTDLILLACEWSQSLRDKFDWLLTPIELDTSHSRGLKEDYERRQKYKQGRTKNQESVPPLEPSIEHRLHCELSALESGELAAWVRVNEHIRLNSDGSSAQSELYSDLTSLPGWGVADETMQLRIIQAAHCYVVQQQEGDSSWIGTHTLPWVEMAGFRALHLLLTLRVDAVEKLPPAVWARWTPIVLAYPHYGDSQGQEIQRHLTKLAYSHVPELVIDTLLTLVDAEAAADRPLFSIQVASACWDQQLADALLVKAKNIGSRHIALESLLNELLDHGSQEAADFAASLVAMSEPGDAPEQRTRRMAAGRALLVHAADAGWKIVWPVIQKDVTFGRELIDSVFNDLKYVRGLNHRLSVEDLVGFYGWLVAQYPPAEDPVRRGGSIGTRERLADWRDSIVTYLRDQGTTEAMAALRQLRDRFPEVSWLKWSVIEAEENLHRHTWIPPSPDHVLQLATNNTKRLIESGSELVDVIIESLGRLEARLTGETSAVRDIWDKTEKGAFRPIDENAFSDYVKRFLDDDLRQRGIVLNREVEIRPGIGSAKGERTDIHVDAVKKDRNGSIYDAITAVIEVKGCWHKELRTAMETQLAAQYLEANYYRQGVYLVGWFPCEGWDPKDYRKKQVPALTLSAFRAGLEEQATELSEQRSLYVRAFVMDTALR